MGLRCPKQIRTKHTNPRVNIDVGKKSMGFPFEKAVDSKLQGQMPGVGDDIFLWFDGNCPWLSWKNDTFSH
jgi:hypothetical protein